MLNFGRVEDGSMNHKYIVSKIGPNKASQNEDVGTLGSPPESDSGSLKLPE